MTRRDWQGGFPAGVDTVAACALVILDLTDAGLRRWFDDHALTAVAGLLLVLMITVLVVDRVLRQRQCNSRICAVDRRAGTDIYAQMSRNFLEQARRLGGGDGLGALRARHQVRQRGCSATLLDDALQRSSPRRPRCSIT